MDVQGAREASSEMQCGTEGAVLRRQLVSESWFCVMRGSSVQWGEHEKGKMCQGTFPGKVGCAPGSSS